MEAVRVNPYLESIVQETPLALESIAVSRSKLLREVYSH
jgi:hypothetical protein